MNIAVVGAGSWGTALAHLLSSANHAVQLWAYEEEVADSINSAHVNTMYQPDFELHPGLRATSDLLAATRDAEMIVCVTPSHVVRDVFAGIGDAVSPAVPLVSATKGLERDTLLTMSAVLAEVMGGHQRIAVLSGPSFAVDVLRGLPTAVTVAAEDLTLADRVRNAVSTDRFRAYSRDDRMGLELGGSLKNVYAIAAGIVDALALGHNTRAALITRGLAEMTRLGVAMGARPETFAGLGGLGDLVLTCTGDQSRNRTVGLRLGAGETMAHIMEGRRTVAEGVTTTHAAAALAARHHVDMPIVEQMKLVLEEKTTPRAALEALMARDLKREGL